MENGITIILPLSGKKDAAVLDSLCRILGKKDEAFVLCEQQTELPALQPAKARIQKKIIVRSSSVISQLNRIYQQADPHNDILLLGTDTVPDWETLCEWAEILCVTEKHGLVCPGLAGVIPAQTRKNLPRYRVLPLAHAPNILLKRTMLTRFGFLDEEFSTLEGAVQELSLRVNQFGFSTVSANRVWLGSEEKKQLTEPEFDLLRRKYPFYDDNLRIYAERELPQEVVFAPLLEENRKKKILFSFYEMSGLLNGSTRHCLSIFSAFYKAYAGQYEIAVVINPFAESIFHLKEKYPNVFFPEELNGLYDIAYSPTQIDQLRNLELMSSHSLRVVFCLQDVISKRCRYWAVREEMLPCPEPIALLYGDGLVSISRFSFEDAAALYPLEMQSGIPHCVIYLSPAEGTTIQEATDEPLPFERYFIVVGNTLKHKALPWIRPLLEQSKYRFILLGSETQGKLAENIYGYQSGRLSSAMVKKLYAHAEGVIFPSAYEGFGLPIVEALENGKEIVIDDNSLNRELTDWLKEYQADIFCLNDWTRLDETLAKISAAPFVRPDKPMKSWDDAARELDSFFEELMAQPINWEKAESRALYFRSLHRACAEYTKTPKKELLAWMKAKVPWLYQFLKEKQQKSRTK